MANSCSNCGKELPDDAKFCMQCGTPVKSAEVEEQPQRNDALFDKLVFETAPGSAVYNDFEKNKMTIIDRATQWAELEISGFKLSEWANALSTSKLFQVMYAEMAWKTEEWRFKTNRPNAHKALFIKTFVDRMVTEAWLRKYINVEYINGEHTLSPTILATLRKMYPNWTEEDIQGQRFNAPDFSDLDEFAKKDDELFPPPQPIRVEVAGAVLNFTTDEAVLVVYMGCDYIGRGIEMRLNYGDDTYISPQYSKVVQRGTADAAICSAIFNNIPLVTDRLRNEMKVLDHITCTVRFSTTDEGEKVTLFRSNVTELDWRGRK